MKTVIFKDSNKNDNLNELLEDDGQECNKG
jgi:hypothetical protein